MAPSATPAAQLARGTASRDRRAPRPASGRGFPRRAVRGEEVGGICGRAGGKPVARQRGISFVVHPRGAGGPWRGRGRTGDRGELPGQQPRADPRDDRQARLRRPADANGQPSAKNTRECGATVDARRPATWENPRPHGGAGPAYNVDRTIPHLAAADERHADHAVLRAGLDRVPLDVRHQPGRLAPRAGPNPPHPGEGRPVPGRHRYLPDRDGRAGRRGPAGGHVGREDGHVHQRRPHRPDLAQGDRPARRGAVRLRHLPRLRPPHGLQGQGRRTADQVVRTPRTRSTTGPR